MTGHLELWVLGLLAAVAGLVMLSNRLGVPYPVFLVLGGLALGLVPIVPEIGLPPDLVLLIFLPPLLYSAALFSPRDLKANLRPIASLSIGFVLLTTITVALVAHLLVGLPWAAAFVLGAIISPTRWRRQPSQGARERRAGSLRSSRVRASLTTGRRWFCTAWPCRPL